ncbi:hypothetical protein SUTH_03235 [Sulfuritalea hydrogenivorans sk43H]|uniref:DUF4139 domain-containing protein n=2 Tax=Sulfuritalea hydrogenivorans TaxID=748811 RepID=W0SMH6_9PROT|nr:hypothetical protein SUTH_03235 [Sulfuritalea hydrogenivorans sk43H]
MVGIFLAAGMVRAGEPVRDVTSSASDREAVAVTVYNDDLALVKERRKVDLPKGLTRLSLREVAAQMRPETALLRAASGQPLSLIEQNFDFDLLTPQKLLEKYVGREVTVIRPHPTTDGERRERATVLAAGQGTVLRFADRIETGVPGRLAFDSVPPNLRDRPTLSILLDAAGGKQAVELSYLTGGLSWKADYVANLSADGKQLDLNGWVTLTNRSGAGFDNATLQLVAGTVNRVRPPAPQMAYAMPASAPRAKSMEATQEALMDYHLYSFERPTSIADNQTKQLALLSASAVPVGREYLLAGNDWYYRDRYNQIGQKLKPAVFLEFENKGGQLGKPLPAGIVRVYARDSKGAAQFVGEDRISHTAKNEKLKLRLGEAFDITAERKQTHYRKIADNVSESSWRIELRNAKDEAVTVKVQEPMPGDWEMVQESQKHTKESARVASWNVAIPAGGTSVLEYGVRVKW